MADTIAEFLATLGVKVDEAAIQRFEQSITRLGRNAVNLSVSMAAGVTAVTAAVTKMAASFETLYYLSQRTRTSVEDIKALQYAFGQVGLTANDAASAITGIAMALRSNPGYGGLLKAWGIDPSESADRILTDLVHTFSRMQPYVAQQYAAMFGISPQLLLQLEQNLPRLEESQRRYNDEARRANVDQGQFAWRSVEFLNSVRDLGTTLELIWLQLSSDSLPSLTAAVKTVNEFLEAHFKDIHDIGKAIGDRFHEDIDTIRSIIPYFDDLIKSTIGWGNALSIVGDIIVYRIFGPLGLVLSLIEQALHKVKSDNEEFAKTHPPGSPGGLHTDPRGNQYYGDPGSPFWGPIIEKGLDGAIKDWWAKNHPSWIQPRKESYSVAPGGNRFRAIEAAYSLPDSILDRVWSAESGRGRFMTSSAGAQGHFQFMPGTAQQYGVADPNNLTQSANGAAHYLFDLLRHYSGSIAKALAAYNWGQGNLDRDVSQWGGAWMQHLPGETSRYLDRILGGSPLGGSGGGGSRGPAVINQQTHITVPGSHDPVKTAVEVATAQRRVNSDLIRNFSGAIVA